MSLISEIKQDSTRSKRTNAEEDDADAEAEAEEDVHLLLRSLAREAAQTVAKHYSQPIHLPRHGEDAEVHAEEVPPYFDPLLGRPLQANQCKITNYWAERLMMEQQRRQQQQVLLRAEKKSVGDTITSNPNEHVQDHPDTASFLWIGASLIGSYHEVIRTKCFLYEHDNDDDDSSSHSNRRRRRGDFIHLEPTSYMVLIHYEQLLSAFFTHHDDHSSSNNKNQQQQEHSMSSQTRMDLLHEILPTIEALVFDIFHLTAVQKVSFVPILSKGKNNGNESKSIKSNRSSKLSNLLIANSILPTLLRILQHSIRIQSHLLTHTVPRITKTLENMNLSSTAITQQHAAGEVQKHKYILAISTLAALSFCPDQPYKDIGFFNWSTTIERRFNATARSSIKRSEPDNHVHDTDISLEESSTTSHQQSPSRLNVEKVHDPIQCTSSNLDALEILPKDWFQSEATLRKLFVPSSTIINADDAYEMIARSRNQSKPHRVYLPKEHMAKTLQYLDVTQNDLDKQFMNKPILHVSHATSSASLPMPWMDHTKGVGIRAAVSLLQCLACMALSLESSLSSFSSDTDRNNRRILHGNQSKISSKSTLSIITHVVGEEYFAEKAREMFFGRLELLQKSHLPSGRMKRRSDQIISKGPRLKQQQVSSRSTSLSFNGIFETKSSYTMQHPEESIESFTTSKSTHDILSDGLGNQSHNIPARIHCAVRILASFTFPSITSEIWDDALPIIFTLIDSYTESQQTLGASLLIHFLNESTPTSIMSKERSQNIEKVLSTACRACNSPLPLFLLSKARCRLFQNLPRPAAAALSSDDAFGYAILDPKVKVIHEALTSSFSWVQKNAYCGPGGEVDQLDKINAILLGSIHPLLEQLAQYPNAMAAELGRPGLSILLPLMRWDSKTERGIMVQMSSMACLVPLLLGAYPIMDRHGGKIMSELAACAFRAQRGLDIRSQVRMSSVVDEGKEDEDTSISIRGLIFGSIYAASIALVISGNRADYILSKIEMGNYDVSSKHWCELVRSGGMALKNDGDRKQVL